MTSLYTLIFCSAFGAACIALLGVALGKKLLKKQDLTWHDVHLFIEQNRRCCKT